MPTKKTKEEALAFEERGNDVVTVVKVPAHEVVVTIATSSIPGCALAAVTAWEKVKGDGDASFDTMDTQFRADLIHAAEGVYLTGRVLEGDSALARFEQEVATIRQAQLDEAKKAKEAEAKKAAKKAA